MFKLILLALVGCQSKTTGNEGNFEFSYWTDDAVVDFNKPIAVGASLDITVASVGDHQPVVLTAASTDDESILAVAGFEADVVTVTGVADGNVLLSVEGTTVSDEALADSINLLVRTPEVLKLSHACTGAGGTAAYLTDSDAFIPFELEMANSQPVIGYGYYPVTVGGPISLDTTQSSQTWMVFATGSAASPATLTSTIDATTLAMEIVAPSAIDGIAEPIAFVLEDIDAGDVNAFYVHPTAGANTVCQADIAKTVASDTPDICDVRDADAADEDIREYGWFEVEGVAAGTCLYTVTFPDGDGGLGVSAQFSTTIEP